MTAFPKPLGPIPSLPQPPSRCDVLVVGAGPAGSAAAMTLARAGVDVVLVDQHDFPREKVCGDGLIPDAHAALRRLGVFDEVMASAQRSSHVACIGPRGGRLDVPGALAVLPRRELDHILCRAALAAGAKLVTPARFDAALEDNGRVVGARLQMGGTGHDVLAQWVVLATGASPQALQATGMCTRRTPSGMALRGYVKNDAMAGRIKALEVVWHPKLRPGYGWIFPAPGGSFNIGVGVAPSHVRTAQGRYEMRNLNLRDVFAAFTQCYAPARELMQGGQMLGELKGAPLRFSLEGAHWSRPGLLVTGEAAGSTYAFTGEGIGKAMETGLHAAEALLAGRAQDQPDAAVRAAYEERLAALRPRFAIYERANRVNKYPWIADLVVWSARRSPQRLKRMEGVLAETHIPSEVASLGGVLRLLFDRR